MATRYAPPGTTVWAAAASTPSVARAALRELIVEHPSELNCDSGEFVDDLLNWMSRSDSVYRVSITERGRSADNLTETPNRALVTSTFDPLKAALIEQERLSFPCLG